MMFEFHDSERYARSCLTTTVTKDDTTSIKITILITLMEKL